MINISLDKLSTVEEIRNTLKPLVNLSPEDQAKYDFSWLEPIITKTVDEDVISSLNSNPPLPNAFITLDLEEHINEATKLINDSLSIRKDIFEIESQALLSAIEYVQTINSIDNNLKLGELDLSATFKQSEEPETNFQDYEDALKENFENIIMILKTKFSFHNQKGNPLNYGEQVRYLRQFYCDNIKNLYERLIAVKRTLKYSCNQETNKLPNYIEISDNLNKLVWWMRDSIYDFEFQSQYDYIIQKTLSLAELCKLRGLDQDIIFKKFADDGFIDIHISGRDFDIDESNEKLRILGLSVNVVSKYDTVVEDPKKPDEQALTYARKANYEIAREHIRFYCEINPPIQSPKLDSDFLFEKPDDDEIAQYNGRRASVHFGPTLSDDSIKFPDKLIVGDLQPIFKTSVLTNLFFLTENSIKNASPIGKWRINLKASFTPRIGTISRLDEGVWGILDVALTFRLSVRKFN